MNPVKNYKAPKFPTLEDTQDKPALLKKLPSRWQKNAAVIACIGLTGAITLSGCNLGRGGAPTYTISPTDQAPMNTRPPLSEEEEALANIRARLETAELELRSHFGGSGYGPFYVAYITEQEVFGSIRAYLEASGLCFNTSPPEYTVSFYPGGEEWGSSMDVGLDLFDKDKNIAIVYLGSHGYREIANEVAERFAQQSNDISVGVFYNHGRTVGWGFPFGEGGEAKEPTDEAKAEARATIIESLTTQVNTFVAWLQAEGIV